MSFLYPTHTDTLYDLLAATCIVLIEGSGRLLEKEESDQSMTTSPFTLDKGKAHSIHFTTHPLTPSTPEEHSRLFCLRCH